MVRLFYAEFVPLDFRYSRNWPLATSAFAFTITITFSFFNDESNVIMDQEQHAPNISKWFAKEIWDIVSFGSQFHEFERKKKKRIILNIHKCRSLRSDFFFRSRLFKNILLFLLFSSFFKVWTKSERAWSQRKNLGFLFSLANVAETKPLFYL